MNRQLITIALVIGCVALISSAEKIRINVAFADINGEFFMDDNATVRDLAKKVVEFHMVPFKEGMTRIESHFGITYNMDKTLKEAGIHDGSKVKLKNWSRMDDILAAMLKPLAG